ncbi:hypothetical protein ALC62_15265 [Cyphomyrmex costatus]|uniref:RNA-directed DNA polymerase from mobile element jockey n=1 Tax=Cyphomyrmex costatus TaxID=456900 RepID=A0A151I7N1_9HYME|nr:hypothetical protein ALC62_15265 [Cyphomyrmex costatus]
MVDGTPIPYSNTVKNLGIHLSADLTWNRQISYISSNFHFAFYRLKFRESALPSSIKLQLVNALLIPHLDYACLVYNDVTDYLNTKLQRLQNTALRFIYNLRYDSPLAPYRKSANWLSVRTRRTYFLGCLMYSVLAYTRPYYLYNRFTLARSEPARVFRRQAAFRLPTCRTNLYQRSFWIEAIHNWNSIPSSIINSSSLYVFKKLYCRYLLLTDD